VPESGGLDVPTYLVESYVPGVTLEEVAAACSRAEDAADGMRQAGTPVQHLATTFVPSEGSVLWLFDGASAQVVEEANRRAGIDFARVVEAIALTGKGRTEVRAEGRSEPAGWTQGRGSTREDERKEGVTG
jgi:hypothetical protein